MAFETTICEECPTPIQWPQLRRHYIKIINIALDARDEQIKQMQSDMEFVAEYAAALQALFMADDDQSVSVAKYRKMTSRVKRAVKAIRGNIAASAALRKCDQRAKEAHT